MLVISPNLILSPADAALPAGTPLILWDNRVTFGNITADSEAAGYPASNMANPATNQEWRAEAAEDVEITITTGTADDIDGVGIAKHNFGAAGIAVEVGYYDETPAWVSLAGPQVPSSDEPLLFWFTPQPLASVVIRLTEGDEAARIAVLYVGPLLIMERGVTIQDFSVPRFARRTEFYNGKSERGDYLGRIVTSQFVEGVEHSYKFLTPNWYRTEMDPFVRAAQQDVPFFYAFAPDEYPFEVSFVWLNDDPVAMTDPATKRMHVTLKMGGIVE